MSGNAKLAGVLGWPVSHSLSPKLHSYWLAQHRLAGAYVALPVEAGDFGRVVSALPRMGFSGVSVTVPHKEAAYAISATFDDDAHATGAVNTLLFRDGGIHGKNTDVMGFSEALTESLGADAARKGPVVVLGAGGAARAILLALQKADAPEIRLVNRTQAKADSLTRAFPKAKIRTSVWGDWASAFDGAGLLINTTSLGLRGKEPLNVTLDALPREAAVCDIIYNPLETALLKAARARGHRVMGGLGMLLHQAVLQFEGFFGVTPRVTPELRAHLKKRFPVIDRTSLRSGPFRLGLTGSIGMGKSETAKMFASLGIPVYDADAVVHALYDKGGAAVAPVGAAFPGVVVEGRVDRPLLAERVRADEAAFKKLEAIVHPLTTQARAEFVDEQGAKGADIVLLDIPLLFEIGADKEVDAVVVVSAPSHIQHARVLARPGMTVEKLEALESRQVPDEQKRAQADFVVETDKGLEHAFEAVKHIVAQLRAKGLNAPPSEF